MQNPTESASKNNINKDTSLEDFLDKFMMPICN